MTTKATPAEQAGLLTETPAPSELPVADAEFDGSVSNDEEFDEDGFVKQEVAQPTQKGPFLVGISDVGTERRITRADFASAGIDQDTLVFEWRNGYRLPLEGINPAASEFLCATEYGFSISDE